VTEVFAWSAPVSRLPLVVATSGLVTLLSRVCLAMPISAFGLAWPNVAVAALLLMAPLGVAVTDRCMRATRLACTDTAISGELLRRLQDPFLKISLWYSNLHLPCGCPAHGGQAEPVEFDRHGDLRAIRRLGNKKLAQEFERLSFKVGVPLNQIALRASRENAYECYVAGFASH